MIACLGERGKSSGMAEIASMPSAVSSAPLALESFGRRAIQSAGLSAVQRAQNAHV